MVENNQGNLYTISMMEVTFVKSLFKKQIIGSSSLVIRSLIDEMMNCIESWNSLDDNDNYEFRLILNELISNGILHGNKGFCNKKVSVAIKEVDSNTLDILIEDEGQGFDYKRVCQECYNFDTFALSEGGRGLMLVNALCKNIQFNENGSQIKITKSICPQ